MEFGLNLSTTKRLCVVGLHAIALHAVYAGYR